MSIFKRPYSCSCPAWLLQETLGLKSLSRTRIWVLKLLFTLWFCHCQRSLSPHIPTLQGLSLVPCTSVTKVKGNTSKNGAWARKSSGNYSWSCERQNWPRRLVWSCYFDGFTAQTSPHLPQPQSRAGAAHTPGHARAHTHAYTTLFYIYLFS